MKNLLKKPILFELLFLFIVSLTPLLWFRGDAIMVGHDNTYPLDPIEFYKTRLSTWTDNSLGYDQSLIMGTLAIHLYDVILPFFGFSTVLSQKILYIFWFFLIGLSAYLLASYLDRKHSIFKLLAAIMYQFNFFVLQGWWIGEKSKFSAYIALPLLLTVFFAVYRGQLPLLIAIALNSLILFLLNGGGMFGLPLFGGIIIVLLTFTLFYIFYSFRLTKDTQAVTRILLLIGGTGMGFLLVNAYYLIPALIHVMGAFTSGLTASGGISGILDWVREISANTSVINLVRLQGIPEWYDNPDHPYAPFYFRNPLLIGLSFIWPLLVLITMITYYKKRNDVVIFLIFTYIISILFVGGSHPPFGSFYELLLRFLPGFAIFRSPYFKFAPALIVSTSFLIAYLFKGLPRKISTVAGLLFIVIWMSYHFPYFTGEFFEWRKGFSTRLHVPDYVYEFHAWTKNEKKDNERILLVPPLNDRWSFETYSWGYLSLTPLNELFGGYPIVSNSIRLQSNEKTLIHLLYVALKENDIVSFTRNAKLLGIGYVLLREDVSLDSLYGIPHEFNQYKASVENNNFLSTVAELGPWKLYKLEKTDPLFYTTPKLNYIDGSPSLSILNAYFSIPQMQAAPYSLSNSIISSPLQSSRILVPNCITCQSLFKPLILIQPRFLLPNSVFYPIVLRREQQLINQSATPRDRINTYLGLTLKRFGELERMFEIDLINVYPVFNLYIEEIEGIRQNFDTLQNEKEKYNIANDLHWYLKHELDYLEGLYGEQLRNDRDIAKLTEVISKVQILLDYIKPFSMVDLEEDIRIFTLYVPQADNYQLFVNSDQLEADSLRIELDDNAIPIDSTTIVSQQWVSGGNIFLKDGEHIVKSIQTEHISRLNPFTPSANKTFANATCYEASVRNTAPNRIYKLHVGANRVFTENSDVFNINLFIKKSTPEGEESEVVVKPYTKLSMVYEDKIQTLGAYDNITITLCGKGLQHSDIQNVYTVSVSEIIEHPFLFLQEATTAPQLTEQPVTRHSPTRYSFTVTVDKPVILVFNEAFDPRWQLSAFNHTHFMVNNFANAWVLDTPGTHHLFLSYYPQTLFYIGVVISGISILTVVTYLVILLKKK